MSPPKDPIKYALWKQHLGEASKGKPKSEAHRRKISEANSGKIHSQEWCNNSSKSLKGKPAWNKGKPCSEELKQKISNANKNPSEELRKKCGEANKGRTPWNKGIPRSQETKEKIRKTKHDNPPTIELRKKMSLSHKGQKTWLGKHHSLESNQKNRVSHLGKIHTEETRKKMSRSQMGKEISESSRIKLVESKLGGFWYGNVKHSDSVMYCGAFTDAFKEGVRKHQNYTCMECGHVWQPGEIRLAVHHVYYNKKACCTQNEEGQYIQTIPMGESKGMKILVEGNPNKFAALCSTKMGNSCHNKTNHNRLYWARKYEKIINEQYNGVSYIPTDKLKEMGIP